VSPLWVGLLQLSTANTFSIWRPSLAKLIPARAERRRVVVEKRRILDLLCTVVVVFLDRSGGCGGVWFGLVVICRG
jgi:hypothetical protein